MSEDRRDIERSPLAIRAPCGQKMVRSLGLLLTTIIAVCWLPGRVSSQLVFTPSRSSVSLMVPPGRSSPIRPTNDTCDRSGQARRCCSSSFRREDSPGGRRWHSRPAMERIDHQKRVPTSQSDRCNARRSAHGRANLLSRSRKQGAGGSAVGTLKMQRQAEEKIVSCLDAGEIQTFKNQYTRAKQSAMGFVRRVIPARLRDSRCQPALCRA